MSTPDRQAHWQNVYQSKREDQVSWFQDRPAPSLELIVAGNVDHASSIIDVGGGASRLVDVLTDLGYRNIAVLDLSDVALAKARERMGDKARHVDWIVADVTTWEPVGKYDIWHDRAAFHFLTEDSDRRAYVTRMKRALHPGGTAIIASFSLEGPEKCSGLTVQRYDPPTLGRTLGPDFTLVETRDHEHRTPWGSVQKFQFSRFRFDPRG